MSITSKPNKKNGATTAMDNMFFTKVPVPFPNNNCPSKLLGEPFMAEAKTSIIPTPAIVNVSTV